MATSELLVTNGTTPGTPASGKSKLFTNTSKGLDTVDDAGLVRVYHNNQDAATFVAGTTAIAPLSLTSGTNLTSAAAGAFEYDGAAMYETSDTTSGRAQVPNQQIFRLTANGGGITTIADFFGSNDGYPFVLNGIYEITWHCYWAHTSAGTGTITWTIVSTQSLTNMVADYTQSPIGGIGTVGTPQVAGVTAQTGTSTALPVTGANTAIASHYARVHALVECSTAGNIRLRMTASAGTATPSRGSYFVVRRLSGGNVGTFVA